MSAAAVQACHHGAGPIPAITMAEFDRFRSLIERLSGIHLKDNRNQFLMARLSRRIRELGLRSFSAYYEYLMKRAPDTEIQHFTNRITVNKTSFFREEHHFELLRSQLVPEVRRRGDRQLRIWSAACSSGEEPYSIAMTIREALGNLNGWDVRIIASDIDTEMLAQAQSGQYPIEALDDISKERRRAHFLRGYGRYHSLVQVRPELREMIDFRQIKLNENDWALPTRFDAIFCRNVIIYFDRPLQTRIITGLTGHLKPRGYLFLGHSETLHGYRLPLVSLGRTAYQLADEGNRVWL